MSKQGLDFVVQASDATAAGFSKVLSQAKGFADKLTGTIAAPFKALASMNTMALVYNVRAIAGAFESLGRSAANAVRQGFMDNVSLQEFAARTATAGQETYQLGRRLEDAASGMMNFDDSVKLANQLMRQGFSVKSLETFFKFASQRATSTGEDFRGMVESLSTAVLTGRTITLNRMGIVIDEVAKKTNLLGSVTDALNKQMKSSGVTGNEAAFSVNRLATAWDDLTDTLKDVVFTSPATEGMVKWLEELVGTAREFTNQNFDRLQGMFTTGLGGVGRAAGGAGAWIKELAGSEGEGAVRQLASTFAKLPVYAMQTAQQMRIAMNTMLIGVEQISKAFLRGPLGAMMEGKDVEKLSYDLTMLGSDAKHAIWEANQELGRLKGELGDIDKQSEGLKLDKKAADAARAMGNAKVAARDWWASLSGIGASMRSIWEPIIGGANKAASATKQAADTIKDAVMGATSSLRDALAAQSAFTGQRDQAEFEIALARQPNPWARANMKYERAQKFLGLTQWFAKMGNQQAATSTFEAGMGVVGEMRRETAQTPGQLKQWDVLAGRFNAIKGGMLAANVGKAEAGLGAAMDARAKALADKGGGGMFGFLEKTSNAAGSSLALLAEKAREFIGVMEAAKASQAGGSGNKTLISQWLEAANTALSAGLR